ncbi:30S ribosomal protein S17e [[Eubacterium] cellulosolvens]
MGKVRPEGIKRIANDLIKKYPDKFSKDFDQNKKNIEEYLIYDAKKMRNRVAGYITRLKKIEENKAKELQPSDQQTLE